eukprot:TRINITY_DN2195_c6_g1_i1.p1 TRINITY_DN2195_c6_g1~~TRINITY_DN2195_c6_g1_i1.p1  ORF type:complete len:688 (+),score=151.69 TRINITY_DN2195_c6_g1_i1:102-2066(+)
MATQTPVLCQVLLRDVTELEADPFEEKLIHVEVQKDTPVTIMEKVGVLRGFLCHVGKVVDSTDVVMKWYNGCSPMVLVPVRFDYIEADDVRSQNPAARLVDAGVPIAHAIKSLGRAYWHRGFQEFSAAATDAKRLVESTSKEPYGDRAHVATLDQFDSLGPIGPFRDSDGELVLPPHIVGHLCQLQVRGDWCGLRRLHTLSVEERAELQRRGRIWHKRKSHIEKVSKAVVRVFGYHAASEPLTPRIGLDGCGTFDEFLVDNSDERYDVVPFTAFFVTPKLLLTTRTSCYNAETETYAAHFFWTDRVRAQHGMLREQIDLHRCKEVEGTTEFLVQKIRSIGVELTDDKVPPGSMAVPWNDLMLLEVESENESSTYLLPAIDEISKGDDLVDICYPQRPNDEWIESISGPKGHDVSVGFRELLDNFKGFEQKVVSLGTAKENIDGGVVNHNCSLAPGTSGSPIVSNFSAVSCADVVASGYSETDEPPTEILTFSAVNCGRSRAEIERKIIEIDNNSTSSNAAKAARSLNMYNCAIAVQHISFILLYQKYIMPEFVGKKESAHLEEFLSPYNIFIKPDVLAACHCKMLKDAEDHNEWGMSFWDRHDIDTALYCFREGARMFCIATIPDMSKTEIILKDALQSNVSAVVMMKVDSTAA